MTASRLPISVSPWITRLSLLGALGLGLLFRWPGLRWGLPLKFAHIDEAVVIHYSMRIVAGALNPGFYDYPGFFLYLLAGLFRILGTLHGVLGGAGMDELAGLYYAGSADFFTLAARALTVGFALLTIGLTFSMGRRRGGAWVGFGAASLLAVNALHVRESHYGTVDVAAAFFTLWAMDRILDFGLSRRVRDGGEAAFLVGLAAATKYYPGILFAPLVLLPWWARHERPVYASAVVSLLTAAGFFCGSPFTLLAGGEFAARFAHLAPKIVGVPNSSAVILPTLANLWRNAGPAALGAGVLGIGYALAEKGVWRLLSVLWLTLFAFLGLWRGQAPHYSLALYPPLFLFAFRAAERIPRRGPAVMPLFAAILLALSVPSSLREVRIARATDTRLLAGKWVRENVPPGSKILRFAHTPEFNAGDPFSVSVDFTNRRLANASTNWEKTRDDILSFDGILYSSFDPENDPVLGVLNKNLVVVHRESGFPPRFPHHPQVTLFAGPGRVR
ncbi:MAG: glycosyltransferase family 39 protein [Elusimicrobia bacterium]|nr:glycosyltransferase family 39 protein [Elusimicrobiota bacterium]